MLNNKANEFEPEQQQLARASKMLSHPARIAILQLLANKKEIKTGNISNFLPIGRTTVSKHLKELKEEGLITGEVEGLRIHYCLNMKKMEEIKNQFNIFFESAIQPIECEC